MLPTFVIGLREGLEAALIVGIIAAFLRKQGRRDLLRSVLVGVGIAVLLCALVGVALEMYSHDLPQKEQEGLETVIGALAVGMVTYMVVWMRRHSRELKGQLEGLAADAIAGTSNAGRAMILMAFLAVIREGFETVVFLLAAINQAGSNSAAGAGAALGIVVAIGLGYGIYRGGVRLNLAKFFRATGFVLVLVAAGLVVNALHTAHEAGWLNAGQGQTVDLTWLAEPGSVQASLLTGMLGVQPHPTLIEAAGWLGYLVPVGCYVLWPPGRSVPAPTLRRAGAATAAASAIVAVVLLLVAPGKPESRPTTAGGGVTVTVVTRSAQDAVVSLDPGGQQVRVTDRGGDSRAGLAVEQYRGSAPAITDSAEGRPSTLSPAEVAARNGGRLPIGVDPADATLPVRYRATTELTVWLDTSTDRVIDLVEIERVVAVVTVGGTPYPLPTPVERTRTGFPAGVVTAAAGAARDAHATGSRRALLLGLAGTAGLVAAGGAVAAAVGWQSSRRRGQATAAVDRDRVEERVRS